MMDDGKKQEPPLFLDMSFDEALTRFARTKPEEVKPPNGRKNKTAKRNAVLAKSGKARSITPPATPKE